MLNHTQIPVEYKINWQDFPKAGVCFGLFWFILFIFLKKITSKDYRDVNDHVEIVTTSSHDFSRTWRISMVA
jgi:hypothetical protein